MPHMKPNPINISTELLALFNELDVTKPVTPDQLRKFTALVTKNTISDSLYRAITNNTRELLHLLEQLTDEIHNQLLADGKLVNLLPKENLERRSSTEPLHIAVEAGYVKMVDTLVNKLNFDPEKPRTILSFSGDGQKFTSQTPLQLVKKAPADSRVAINDVLSLAISNKSQRYTEATDIIAKGDAEKFKQTICREGKPALFLLNEVTPLLHLAALHGQLDIVTWLIDECNANPNKTDPETGSNILGFIEYKAKELRKDLNTPTYNDIFIKLFGTYGCDTSRRNEAVGCT